MNFFIINNPQNHGEYYTEEQFKISVIMDRAISIIHFNSKSLNSNLSKIKQCLGQLDNKSTVMAITYTWVNEEKSDMVEIEVLNFFC